MAWSSNFWNLKIINFSENRALFRTNLALFSHLWVSPESDPRDDMIKSNDILYSIKMKNKLILVNVVKNIQNVKFSPNFTTFGVHVCPEVDLIDASRMFGVYL